MKHRSGVTRSTLKRQVPRHVFNEDVEGGGFNGERWCLDCPLPEKNEAHESPEVLAEQRKHDARRVGERVDDD